MPTLGELHQKIGGELLQSNGIESSIPLGPVLIDSRQVKPGDLFWGLEGEQHNGSDFAWEAFQRGAKGVVIDQPVEVPPGCWAVRVMDTLGALWHWASHVRRQFSGTVVAVTGSVGKTTTRQMIHTVLKSRLSGTASPRNYNNQVGVPLSLLQLVPGHDYAVLELGASHAGEIVALASLCRPRIGVITRIGDAHLGEFGSQQGIAEAKAELLTTLPPDGQAILGDDLWLRSMADRCPVPITWVGSGPECDLSASDVRTQPGRLEFRVGAQHFRVPVYGKHHLVSALAAIAVARTLGFDFAQIAAALAHFEPMPMRCEVVEIRGATIINDAYNSSPTAMRAALELLRDADTAGRRIVVCGDMAELGENAGILHWQLGNEVATLCRADLLIACGQYARHVVAAARAAGMPSRQTIFCDRVEEALPYLGQAIMPGDTVLVKGSRNMAMERVIDALQNYPLRRSA
jgi:UDP-N-acetylmuramoyl-tripeptide--D-alanyl-D-alanine ligase